MGEKNSENMEDSEWEGKNTEDPEENVEEPEGEGGNAEESEENDDEKDNQNESEIGKDKDRDNDQEDKEQMKAIMEMLLQKVAELETSVKEQREDFGTKTKLMKNKTASLERKIANVISELQEMKNIGPMSAEKEMTALKESITADTADKSLPRETDKMELIGREIKADRENSDAKKQT